MNKKIKGTVLFTALFLLFSTAAGYCFQSKGQDCSKCHSLKKDEALLLLKNFNQNINIINIKKGPVNYLWEIDFEINGKKGIVYIDLPKKHIFDGSLMTIESKKNLTRERLTDINRVNASKIPLQDAIVLGDKGAAKKIIVFDDPD